MFDDAVGIFGIVFRDECLNAGRIKDGHIGFGGVDGLANRFGEINEVIKDRL